MLGSWHYGLRDKCNVTRHDWLCCDRVCRDQTLFCHSVSWQALFCHSVSWQAVFCQCLVTVSCMTGCNVACHDRPCRDRLCSVTVSCDIVRHSPKDSKNPPQPFPNYIIYPSITIRSFNVAALIRHNINLCDTIISVIECKRNKLLSTFIELQHCI